jgi:hypothetical protein
VVAQHALGPMRQCFDPHTGQLKAQYRRDMASWPSLGHRYVFVVKSSSNFQCQNAGGCWCVVSMYMCAQSAVGLYCLVGCVFDPHNGQLTSRYRHDIA